jgi:hypothetical protein
MNDAITPVDLFGDLPVTKFCFQVHFPENNNLPPFLGSAWRGLIGWEMQRLICPFDRRPSCKHCSIRDHCPYFMLFEEQSGLPGQMESPRGYVLYPPASKQNDVYKLYVTFFGNCVKLLPVMAKSILNGCDSGVGSARVPYRISAWEQVLPGGQTIALPLNLDGYLSAEDATGLKSWLGPALVHERKNKPLSFCILTPLRLRKQGRYMGDMDGPFLFETIARRLESLCCHYNNGKPLGRERWEKLKLQFTVAREISGELEWKDYARYSNRQKTKVPMGGLVGKAMIKNPPAWVMEWLHAANLVHIGKGAAMGLGRIEI